MSGRDLPVKVVASAVFKAFLGDMDFSLPVAFTEIFDKCQGYLAVLCIVMTVVRRCVLLAIRLPTAHSIQRVRDVRHATARVSCLVRWRVSQVMMSELT